MKIYLRLFKESLQFAVNSLKVNLLRTFLSLLGITLGIFVIVGVLALVDSMVGSIEENLDELGNDIIIVSKWPIAPEDGESEYAWWKYWQRPPANLDDLAQLKKRMTKAEALAFRTADEATIQYYNSSLEKTQIIPISHDMNRVETVKIVEGRYFSQRESMAGNNVCLLGANVKEDLFGPLDPLGKIVKIKGRKTRVIGTIEKNGEGLGGSGYDEMVIVPVHFAKSFLDLKNNDNNSIFVKGLPGQELEDVKGEIISKMRSIRRLRPKDDKNFAITEMTLFRDLIGIIAGLLNTVAIFLGALSILVGGFNIANIMFVSVKERTNQIGIQKALGARNSFIRIQFLFESIVLCLIGGSAGILLIEILFGILNIFDLGLDFNLSMENRVLGLVISATIGVIAGFFPAWKASRLDPV
ncbi:MAG: ABC transporter permease, partial [Bacteroidota bacterium]